MFGAVKLIKNVDIDHIGFDRKWFFSFGYGSGRNVRIFAVDMSWTTHINNKKKDILVLGTDPTQRLEHALTAEKLYSINFTKNNKNFCLILHCNGANSYVFVNGRDTFKAKGSEIVTSPSCLGNVSKD